MVVPRTVTQELEHSTHPRVDNHQTWELRPPNRGKPDVAPNKNVNAGIHRSFTRSFGKERNAYTHAKPTRGLREKRLGNLPDAASCDGLGKLGPSRRSCD